MKVLISTLAILFGLAVPAAAQTFQATPDSDIGWDQAAATLATAQGYVYSYSIDLAAYVAFTTPIVCGAGPNATTFACRTDLPIAATGSHTITLRAANAAGNSLPSTAITFVMTLVPAVPGNVTILPPPPGE